MKAIDLEIDFSLLKFGTIKYTKLIVLHVSETQL